MLAQKITTRHPPRVRTLTSISSTPSTKMSRPRLSTIRTIMKVGKRPVRNADDYAQHLVDLQPLIATAIYPADEEEVKELGRRAYDRGHDQDGVQRASGAVAASGDRRAELAGVRVPTLVLHGSDDVMVRPAAGQATADAIPGARLVGYPGMGHTLPWPLWPDICDEIRALASTSHRLRPA